MPYQKIRCEAAESGVATLAPDDPDDPDALGNATLGELICVFEAHVGD